jgi:uncharacterized protein
MAINTLDISTYAPGFKVSINGSELEPAAAYSILNLKIEQELNKTNGFTFEVQDEFREGRFHWLQTDLFHVANSVSISIGYPHKLMKMLDGKIKTVNGSFNTGCAPTFTVEGMDKAYDFLITPSETKVFREKHDSDTAREIARLADLEADVEATEAVVGVKTKAGGKSYLEFLQRLAKDNNYEFFLAGRKLHFRKHKYDDAVATLTWGRDLIRFEPQLNTTSAVTKVIVRGWDASGKKTIEGEATTGSETVQEGGKQTSSEMARALFGEVVKVITDRPVRTKDEAKKLAQSELETASNNLVQATVDTIGTPELVPGVCLQIDGFGSLFSGKYYVVKATHTINADGYRTSLTTRRNAL